jgi:DNA-binding response OmpR family regulator
MMKELGVLVVEDDPMIREILRDSLSDAHFHVMDADTTAHARDVLNTSAEIAAAFVDVDLGDREGGYAVARHARATRPDLLIVYTSGGAREDFEQERVPGSLFLPKPYLPSQVCSLLRATLEPHR